MNLVRTGFLPPNAYKSQFKLSFTETKGYEALVHHHFENGIKKVTPYVFEPGSELDLSVLVSDFGFS